MVVALAPLMPFLEHRKQGGFLGRLWGKGGDLLCPSGETGGRGLSPSPRGLPQLLLASEKGETLGPTELSQLSGSRTLRSPRNEKAGVPRWGSALAGRGPTVLVDEV